MLNHVTALANYVTLLSVLWLHSDVTCSGSKATNGMSNLVKSFLTALLVYILPRLLHVLQVAEDFYKARESSPPDKMKAKVRDSLPTMQF